MPDIDLLTFNKHSIKGVETNQDIQDEFKKIFYKKINFNSYVIMQNCSFKYFTRKNKDLPYDMKIDTTI